jgi:predicted transcriptional regulator
VRILTDIPDADIEKLDALAARRNSSRAAAIRDAVKVYLAQHADRKSWIAHGAGFWKDRDETGDAADRARSDRSRAGPA